MTPDTAYHGPMGAHFAAHATHSTYNAHTDRPAMLELAGDVTDLRILDLGCGAGHYAEEFLAGGAAHITALDGSATLVRAARDRIGPDPRVALYQHDLEQPLDFLADAAYDLAVLALVYHHIDAHAQLLAGIRRLLRPGGTLLVSTTHPTADWRYAGGSYFETGRLRLPFDEFTLSYRRLTVETFLGELLGAGFVLERLVEARAVEAARRADPRRYEKTHREPTSMAVRLNSP